MRKKELKRILEKLELFNEDDYNIQEVTIIIKYLVYQIKEILKALLTYEKR